MNNDRRKRISKAWLLIDQAEEILSQVLGEEEESYDNLLEGLQNGARGEQMQEYIETLGEVDDKIQEIKDDLDGILNRGT